MHLPVVPDSEAAGSADGGSNDPLENRVAPPRGVGVGEHLNAVKANLAESRADELLRVGNEQAGTTDLAHGRGDQVSDNKLDVDAVGLKLRSQRSAPVLQEGLTTAVGSEVRGRHNASEGAEGEDKAVTALDEERGNDLSGLEGAQAVDGDDVLHLVTSGLEKRYGDAVRLANIVDQDADVQTVDELGQTLIVGVVILSVVHGQSLNLQASPPQGELASESIELGLGTRDEDEIETLGSELLGKLFA